MARIKADQASLQQLLEEIRSLYAFLDAHHLSYAKTIEFEDEWPATKAQPAAGKPWEASRKAAASSKPAKGKVIYATNTPKQSPAGSPASIQTQTPPTPAGRSVFRTSKPQSGRSAIQKESGIFEGRSAAFAPLEKKTDVQQDASVRNAAAHAPAVDQPEKQTEDAGIQSMPLTSSPSCLRPDTLVLAWQADAGLKEAALRPFALNLDGLSVLDRNPEARKPLSVEDVKDFQSLFFSRSSLYYLRSKRGYFFLPCENYDGPACKKSRGEKIVCWNCPAAKQKPLSSQMIEAHLRSPQTLAIAPFYEDGTTFFIQIRLRGEEASLAYAELSRAAKARSLPFLGEARRIDQENVWVLWMFFSMPIDAGKAARFGQAFVLDAFSSGELSSLSALDELFPSLPFSLEKAAGERIGLPLGQFYGLREISMHHLETIEADGSMIEKSNQRNPLPQSLLESVLIDEQGRPILNPMEKIRSLGRIDVSRIDAILSSVRERSLLAWFEEDPASLITLPPAPATLFDLPAEPASKLAERHPVVIELHGRVYVKAGKLPVLLQMQIYALGCYWNPAYTRKNAKYTSGPRVIEHARRQADENGEIWISLPRHLDEALYRLLEERGYAKEVIDCRLDAKKLDLHFEAELRAEQKPLLDALLLEESGILEAATGTGKTVIGAALIAKRKVPTLVLVNSKEILQGWVSALNQFLRFEKPEYEQWQAPSKNYPGKIGVLQGNTQSLDGRVDIAMVPTLYKKKDLDDILSRYGMILVDECHHAGSSSYQMILDRVQSRYVYGFSATPERTDQKSVSVFWQLGRVLASFSSREQMKKQSFFRLMMPRITPYVSSYDKEEDFLRLCQEAAEHPLRNALIIADVKEALANHRTVLVLTRFVEHANRLARMMEDEKDLDLFIYAGNPEQKQENTRRLQQRMAQAKNGGRKTLLIGTYSSVSEGFDFPQLDTLMLALPISAKTSISQSIGRIHRQIENKQVAIVYDYLDAKVPMFERMYHTRAAEYSDQGYQIGEAQPYQAPENDALTFFDEEDGLKEYSSLLHADLHNAQKNIALCVRMVDPKKMPPVLRLLKARADAGVRCDLFVERIDEPARMQYEQAGLHVHVHPRISTMALIIDSKIIYYGNIYSKAALVSMQAFRLDSKDCAGELLESRRQAERELRRLEKEKQEKQGIHG